MSEIKDFKDLIIWQKGMDIAEKCYYLTKSFPKEELYGMVQQLRKERHLFPPITRLVMGGKVQETMGDFSTSLKAQLMRFKHI